MRRFLSFFQPALFAFSPEKAHSFTLKALACLPAQEQVQDDICLQSTCFGLNFPNPIGMAAGFDKNAEVAAQLLNLGFGFLEVGGITPHPQTGNPQPRVFRLIKDRALINRLGFNNDGIAIIRARLEKNKTLPGVIGANIGANKDSQDRIGDYEKLLLQLNGLTDFVTLNISSPNTPGLRNLQDKDALNTLLSNVMEKRERVISRAGERLPILIKIAPDLTLQDLDEICSLSLQHGVDGLIVSNTTVSRPILLDHALAKEAGGLSGRPLFALSTRMLALMRQRVGKDMVLIGVGGIDSGEAAWAKICAGANLLQLYTGLIYRGLNLIDEIKATLLAKLAEHGFSSLQQAVGCKNSFYAQEIGSAP
jgi:dihydroorotate dehydrogenase